MDQDKKKEIKPATPHEDAVVKIVAKIRKYGKALALEIPDAILDLTRMQKDDAYTMIIEMKDKNTILLKKVIV